MLRLVKSWIGEISANSSLSPSRRNQSNESRWTLIRLGMGATSLMRANECLAAPSVGVARETGRASARAMGLLTPPLCVRGTGKGQDDQEKERTVRLEDRGDQERFKRELQSIGPYGAAQPQNTNALHGA